MKKEKVLCSLGNILFVLIILFTNSCQKEGDNPPSEREDEKSYVIFQGTNGLSNWEPGDFIFVVDGSNIVKSQTLAQGSDPADFYVDSQSVSLLNSPVVFYSGSVANAYNKVRISESQEQTEPDNIQNIGKNGDCGYAEVVKNTKGENEFALDHKSAIVCFNSWVDADLTKIGLDGRSIKLKSISIMSTEDIAGDYILSSSGLTEAGNQVKTITLDCGEGFILANSEGDARSAAGAYMVIAPSKSKITIKYVVEYFQVVPTQGETVALQNTIVREIEDYEFIAGEINTINCHITKDDLEKVDLGNGTQGEYTTVTLGEWSIRNVGETTDGLTESVIIKPCEPGGYFDFGATVSLSRNDKSNTLWSESKPFGWVRSIDEGLCLTDIGHDVARNLWGQHWRMPTSQEITNLCYGATWEVVGIIAPTSTLGYIAGYKVSGSNGNSIYLPAAGYIYPDEYCFVGRLGWYWSSTPAETTYSPHLSMWLNENGCGIGNGWRDVAQSIRPVYE